MAVNSHLKILLVISFLVVCGLSTYSLKNSYYIYPTPLKMALAPTPITNRYGNIYDMALAFDNNTVRITTTDAPTSLYDTFNYITNSTINFLDWNQAGVCVGTSNQVCIFDPVSMSSKLYLQFTGRSILSVACGYRTSQQPPTLVVAVAFSNNIEIYQGITFVYNRSLTYQFQSMAMDKTAKYLYYCEGSIRYTLDLWNRRVYSQYATAYPLTRLTTAKSTGHYDISAGVSSSSLTLWDDYYLLSSYTPSSFLSNYSIIAFTYDDSYLVIMDSGRYAMTLWRTNFNSYSSWSTAKEFSVSTSTIYSLDCENKKIAYLYYNNLYIYQSDQQNGGPVTLIIIIVCSVVGFILCVAIISFFVRKRRIQQQQINGGYNNLPNQTSNQGFNPNPQGWNNNPNQPTNWNNNPNSQNTWAYPVVQPGNTWNNNNPNAWNNNPVVPQNSWGNNQGANWSSNQNQNQNQGWGNKP